MAQVPGQARGGVGFGHEVAIGGVAGEIALIAPRAQACQRVRLAAWHIRAQRHGPADQRLYAGDLWRWRRVQAPLQVVIVRRCRQLLEHAADASRVGRVRTARIALFRQHQFVRDVDLVVHRDQFHPVLA